MPAFTADYFGPKNLGFNYGLVFIGWGIAFFVPLLAGYLKDATGSLDYAFYVSAGLLVTGLIISRFLKRPWTQTEKRKPPTFRTNSLPGGVKPVSAGFRNRNQGPRVGFK